MTECNGCGACCHPFQMIHSPTSITLGREILFDGSLGRLIAADQLAFAREHLEPIRRGDGRRMVASWSGGYSEVIVNGDVRLIPSFYYRCDLYDPETRRCTDYDRRPSVCRDYPWYGAPPDPNKQLPPTCSFNDDVGRPVADEVPVAAPARRP